MLAIGGLVAYSEPAQTNGPVYAKDVWEYEIESITEEQFAERLAQARNEAGFVAEAERRADELLATPNVTLRTQRKFVVNSFLALGVCERLMGETGASNFGFGRCMGRQVIEMLDTPPCLVLSLANDAGYTAYCHTDLSHTFPGVLMRWIAGRPTFVCNSHFPHDGLFTVAHCAAPRKMNGKDYEPATIMTHYESDYGAACRVEYTKGQTVTVVIPNLRCTKWQGFRGTIVESPAFPACRSQMEIAVDGLLRWKGFTRRSSTATIFGRSATPSRSSARSNGSATAITREVWPGAAAALAADLRQRTNHGLCISAIGPCFGGPRLQWSYNCTTSALRPLSLGI
jgi:hypothetical protein